MCSILMTRCRLLHSYLVLGERQGSGTQGGTCKDHVLASWQGENYFRNRYGWMVRLLTKLEDSKFAVHFSYAEPSVPRRNKYNYLISKPVLTSDYHFYVEIHNSQDGLRSLTVGGF